MDSLATGSSQPFVLFGPHGVSEKEPLLPHHFSAGTLTFKEVKSASLCHHSQNMVILELDPWFIRSCVEIDYQFHLSTLEDLSLIAS